ERQERLIGPMRNIYGVSDKILTMTLSGLLLGVSDDRPNWFETGKGMIAIAFSRQFPKVFPRFVQHAIWRFCAADGLNICNGNRIDDRKSCQNTYCQL